MSNKLKKEPVNQSPEVQQEAQAQYQFILRIRMDGNIEISPNLDPKSLINLLQNVITGILFATIESPEMKDSRIIKPNGPVIN